MCSRPARCASLTRSRSAPRACSTAWRTPGPRPRRRRFPVSERGANEVSGAVAAHVFKSAPERRTAATLPSRSSPMLPWQSSRTVVTSAGSSGGAGFGVFGASAAASTNGTTMKNAFNAILIPFSFKARRGRPAPRASRITVPQTDISFRLNSEVSWRRHVSTPPDGWRRQSRKTLAIQLSQFTRDSRLRCFSSLL